mgnify:CR=1 FL=1
MANINSSDMFAKRVFQGLLRSGGIQQRAVPSFSQQAAAPTLAQLAGLSTYDKPAAPSIEENAYYDKYRAKLEKIKLTDPEKYKSAMEAIYGKNRNDETSAAKSDGSDIKGSSMLERMQSTSKNEQPESKEKEAAPRKGLNDIIKLDLLADKSSSEIAEIWTQYYSTKDRVLYATVPVDKYVRIKSKGKECPQFLYALPREEGFEFLLGQCSNDDWYYTPLLAFQTHGEFAPYSLSVNYYTELAEEKGIVLMKGEIASDDLGPELATLLVHQTQLMYGSDENFELVKTMHERPDDFKHMNIIDVCKKSGVF